MPETTPAGTNDSCFTSFDKGFPLANNTVLTTALQPDGKVIIGGHFTIVNNFERNRIARLNADGTIDESFNPGTGFNNRVNTMALQPDGKVVVGGSFTEYNGTLKSYLTRLNADGSLDPSYSPSGLDLSVQSLVLQTDGKVIVGGRLNPSSVPIRGGLARINADGTLDLSFNRSHQFNDQVETLALQPDGKVIVGGNFHGIGSSPMNRIMRFNTDGQLDLSFNTGTGFNSTVFSLIVQPDGKVIAGGQFASFNGTPRNRIARLNTDGSLDGSFDPGTSFPGFVRALGLQPNGKLLVGGLFTSFMGTPTSRVTRLNADGSLDASFHLSTGLPQFIYSIILQPDGKMIVGGNFTTYQGLARNYITRVDSNGSVDPSFFPGSGFNSRVSRIYHQPDGKMVVLGDFNQFNGTLVNGIARLNLNGTLDGSFHTGTLFNLGGTPHSLLLKSDGTWIVGGNLTTVDGRPRNYIARLFADGSLDTTDTFGTGFNVYVNALINQPDGKLIAGGAFTTFNGVGRTRIARINSDGTLDNSFTTGRGFNGNVQTLALQPDGKVIVGGFFTTYNGITKNYVARLHNDGTLDASFDPGTVFNHYVDHVVLQPDGKVLVIGRLRSSNGPGARIARLHTDGSLDATFVLGTGFDQTIETLALQSDGKVLVGGFFTSFNGTPRNYIARLNDDGTLDSSLDPGTGFNAPVHTLALQPDGKLLVGGTFTSFNGLPESHITRLFAYSPTVTSLSSTNGTQTRPHSTGKSSSTLLAYPNPARSSFRLRGLNQGASVTLHDVTGRRVLAIRPGSEGAIDVSALPAGLYRWHTGSEQGTVVVE